MKKYFAGFSWTQFLSMVTLVAIGVVAIWSSGHARDEIFHNAWMSTLQTALWGLVIYFALSAIDYRHLFDLCAVPSYFVAIALLVAVLLLGSTIYGGKRWLWFFQPSEISKLCVIMASAAVFGMEERPRFLNGFRGFAAAMLLLGVPCFLILLEPDLGTALTLVPAFIAMIYMANVWRRGILTIMAIGIIAITAVLGLIYEAQRPGVTPERREAIMKYVPLKDHQVKRVKTFLFPDTDVLGTGYNLRQAKISIGSGGFRGKGIGKAQTNRLKYLPPSVSMNDFIFCIYAEETGFAGSCFLLMMYCVLCLSCIKTAWVANDFRGKMFATGVSVLIFAHVYINIAMSIGLVPITGLPLPFVSSGRTFLITLMCALGLVQSVSIHNKESE